MEINNMNNNLNTNSVSSMHISKINSDGSYVITAPSYYAAALSTTGNTASIVLNDVDSSVDCSSLIYTLLKQKIVSKEFLKALIKEFNVNNNFCFDVICEYQKLDDELYDMYANNLNWTTISKYQNLTYAQLTKYANRLNWQVITARPEFYNELFFDTFKDRIDWKIINGNDVRNIPNFINKYKDYLNWSRFSSSYNWTAEEIDKYQDRIDWTHISENPCLTENTILKFKDKLNIHVLSRAYDVKLTPKIIDALQGWDWVAVPQYHHNCMTSQIVFKYGNNPDFNFSAVQDLAGTYSEDVLYKYMSYFDFSSPWLCSRVFKNKSLRCVQALNM